MTISAAAQVLQIISASDFVIPLSGHGDAATRFRTLARLTRSDIAVGRMVEAHLDADVILQTSWARRPAQVSSGVSGRPNRRPPYWWSPRCSADRVSSRRWTAGRTPVWREPIPRQSRPSVSQRVRSGSRATASTVRASGTVASASRRAGSEARSKWRTPCTRKRAGPVTRSPSCTWARWIR